MLHLSLGKQPSFFAPGRNTTRAGNEEGWLFRRLAAPLLHTPRYYDMGENNLRGCEEVHSVDEGKWVGKKRNSEQKSQRMNT